MKTVVSGNEVSYEMEWEFCPLRTDRGNASTSGSSPKGAASATGKKVTATIATSIPPGVRVSQSQSSGLYGGAYAVPSLTLIETERGEQPTLAPPHLTHPRLHLGPKVSLFSLFLPLNSCISPLSL